MKKLMLLFILTLPIFAIGQKEASNWYFGENAGIQFNVDAGTVIPISEGQLNTLEGCASISNIDGELQFYTDGSTVYNRLNGVMPNGTDLLGDTSSSQSALIIPEPNNPDIYYIFTVGSNISETGLHYSVVDITLNGGLGSVTEKNILLLSKCAEKISAVLKDCSTGAIWVVALSNNDGTAPSPLNSFHAFEVSDTGIDKRAVVSTLSINISDSRGYLKLSPDGTKLACANVQSGLYLFDFDSTNGIVSNPKPLRINDTTRDKPYGLEFSPNNQFLYVSASNDFFVSESENNIPSNHKSILLQYDLTATDISGSQKTLDKRDLFRGALQLGPNGKIYRALSATYLEGLPFLGVINNPNSAGVSSNYVHNAVFLGDKNSFQGLPPFVQSFFNKKIDIIKNGFNSTKLSICIGGTYTLTAEDLPDAEYIWTRNGELLPENDFDLVIDKGGNYEVFIKLEDNACSSIEGQAIVRFVDFPKASDATLIQCEDEIKDGKTPFNLAAAFESIAGRGSDVSIKYYLTEDDARNGVFALNPNAYVNETNPQTLYTEVINNGLGIGLEGGETSSVSQCSSYSQLKLVVSETQIEKFTMTVCDELESEDGITNISLNEITPKILSQFGNDPSITIAYYRSYTDALSETNPLTKTFTNTTPYLQTLYGRIENENDCFGINEVDIVINRLPNLIPDSIVNYCTNLFPEPILINAGLLEGSPSDFTYVWSNGSETYETSINEVGQYNVTVTNFNGCSKSRTITVEGAGLATINNIDITDISKNNSITVDVSGEGIYEYALFDENGEVRFAYQTNPMFNNIRAGIYTISIRDIKNNCGSVNAKISVIGYPKFFTPNNDGVHDTWTLYGVSSVVQPNSKIFIYNRFGKLLKQLDPLGAGWDGTFNGRPLPTDDYWFAVTLQDGRTFKSHFTLKL